MASTEHVISSRDSVKDIVVSLGVGLFAAYIIKYLCDNGNCVVINKTCKREKHLFQNNYRKT